MALLAESLAEQFGNDENQDGAAKAAAGQQINQRITNCRKHGGNCEYRYKSHINIMV